MFFISFTKAGFVSMATERVLIQNVTKQLPLSYSEEQYYTEGWRWLREKNERVGNILGFKR